MEHHHGPAPSPGPHLAPGGAAGHAAPGEHTPAAFRNRLIISLILTLPILYFAEPVQSLLGYRAISAPVLRWTEAVLAAAIYGYGGSVFIQGAISELQRRMPGMMTLVALAITAAFGFSLAVTLGLPAAPFYWELATLVDVMLLGHWLEMASVQGASRALTHLAALIPPIAHRISDGQVADVPVDSLRAGMLVLVRPGEQVPVDGVVRRGISSLDESFLTGESRPVRRGPGDEVIAGAVNGEGALEIAVTRTGEATTLSQIMRLVAEAQSARSHYQALADRAAFWLTIAALTASALTTAAWLLRGADLTFTASRAVTVLVIACPHALGLAIPLVVVNATGLAAHHGILVRHREAFERARNITVVALDKTGTVTEGRFTVRAVYAEGLTASDALGLAASLEILSEHPLARAITEAARAQGARLETVNDFRAIPGSGVEGEIGGTRYRVGQLAWLLESDLPLSPALKEGLREAETRGDSVIALARDRTVLALFALADRIRPTAREAVAALQGMGIQVIMVTGDAETVARTVAQELGISRFFARVLPGDKAALVNRLRSEGRSVAFVGDGINDAPALVAADLGIAIGAGTNVAIESADLILVESDPLDVVRALRLARLSYRKMVENLLWATGYNFIAIPLAAGVAARWGILLPPAVGALLMSASTIIVALNALSLRRAPLNRAGRPGSRRGE